MKLRSIQSKVLLMFLLLTAVLLLVMSVMVRYGFNQQLNAYKQNQAELLNQQVVETLEAYYQQNGSWDELQNNGRLWAQLLVESAVNIDLKAWPRGKQQRHELPEKDGPDRQVRPGNQKKPNNQGRPNNQLRPDEPVGDNPGMRRLLPQFYLMDQQNNQIAGRMHRPVAQYEKKQVVFKDQTVGYLLALKPQPTDVKKDKKLNHSMTFFLWILGLVMLLITLLTSWPIARYLTKPIKAINTATQKAAAGDYNIRTHIERSDELGQLGQNFNVLTQTLASNAVIQKKLMADISHELRTPVAVLKAQIEAIQDGVHQADEKTLSLLHDQIDALAHLINDLHQLSVTELGSMQYQMQAVDMRTLLTTVVVGQRLLAEQQGINVVLQLPDQALVALGDDNRLSQLLSNLINNAIKYTDSNKEKPGQVLINAWLDEENNEVSYVVIEIKDSAPGLEPHEMQQMFDRLYRQEHSRNKKTGGSGLGLAIVKNITEAHHGEIKASASDLGGVCLTVRLPKHV